MEILKSEIDEAFKQLSTDNTIHERRRTYLSFRKICDLKQIFEDCLLRFDHTIEQFKWLPEYDDILKWLNYNQGKGLFMTGDCGRGKTDIILGVILPLYMIYYKKHIPGFHASQLPEKVSFQHAQQYTWNFELYKKWKVAYIDELGVERMVNDFGEKFEAFNEILNCAEQNLNILIISTNLTGDEFHERYGDRSTDRLTRLCQIIKFEGPSLRKP